MRQSKLTDVRNMDKEKKLSLLLTSRPIKKRKEPVSVQRSPVRSNQIIDISPQVITIEQPEVLSEKEISEHPFETPAPLFHPFPTQEQVWAENLRRNQMLGGMYGNMNYPFWNPMPYNYNLPNQFPQYLNFMPNYFNMMGKIPKMPFPMGFFSRV